MLTQKLIQEWNIYVADKKYVVLIRTKAFGRYNTGPDSRLMASAKC